LWVGNPVYEQRRGNWPIGWILENREKQVVGFSGNIPIACEFSGTALTAAVTSAWVVDADYRSHSMLLAAQYFAQKNVDLLLNTTAIHAAGQIFRAFHAKPVPVEDLDSTLFWVLDRRRFARSVLTRKGMPLAAIMSHPAAAVVALAGWIKGRAARQRSLPPVNSTEEFDERFDRFWQQLRKQSNAVLSVRDRQTLQWHFRRSRNSKGLWIYTHEADGRLTSYGIFQRQDKEEVGLTRVRLVDFQTLDSNPLILDAMISAALHRSKVEGVQMLEVVGFAGAIRSRLERIAPFRRRLSAQLFYYKALSKDLKVRLADPQVWQPCSYDGDSSL
jgi:hypothetical protein